MKVPVCGGLLVPEEEDLAGLPERPRVANQHSLQVCKASSSGPSRLYQYEHQLGQTWVLKHSGNH